MVRALLYLCHAGWVGKHVRKWARSLFVDGDMKEGVISMATMHRFYEGIGMLESPKPVIRGGKLFAQNGWYYQKPTKVRNAILKSNYTPTWIWKRVHASTLVLLTPGDE